MDFSQIVPYILAHAQWLGPALLGVGILVHVFGRALSRILLGAGVLATAAFSYQEWQILHSVYIAAGILLLGLVVFGLLAWTIRGISFLFAFVLIAAAFYLMVFGWMGPTFAASTLGSLMWSGGAILAMVLTGLRTGGRRAAALAVGA